MEDIKDIKENNKSDIAKLLKLYVLPLITISIFAALMVFLTIPKLSQIFSDLDLISIKNDEVTEKDAKIADLVSLQNRLNDVQNQLNIVNGIAPTGVTQVVVFRDKISSLITQNNLKISSQRLNEISPDTPTTASPGSDTQVLGNIILSEIPFFFEVSGRYEDILGFIKDLNSIDDFIIVKEMELASAESQGDQSVAWSLKLNMTKYQFGTRNTDLLQRSYLKVDPTAKIGDIMQQYIDARLATPQNSLDSIVPTELTEPTQLLPTDTITPTEVPLNTVP